VTGAFEFSLNRFVPVELAIDDDSSPFIFARDRLISRFEINDAQPRMPKSSPAVWAYPMALPIGAAVMEAPGGPLNDVFRDRVPAR